MCELDAASGRQNDVERRGIEYPSAGNSHDRAPPMPSTKRRVTDGLENLRSGLCIQQPGEKDLDRPPCPVFVLAEVMRNRIEHILRRIQTSRARRVFDAHPGFENVIKTDL